MLDHDVVLPDGTVVTNPLRVLANDAGSEVVFTLYRRPGMTAAEFDADPAAVEADLGDAEKHPGDHHRGLMAFRLTATVQWCRQAGALR